MHTPTSIELSCAREIPFKSEIIPFFSKIFYSGITEVLPLSPLLKKRPAIAAALNGQPLYVNISCNKTGPCVDPKFVRSLKSFFKRDVVVEMHLKKGEVTLILF